MSERPTRWKTEDRCVRCQHELTFHERFHSCGICPHCGHRENKYSTMCATTAHIYRDVVVPAPTRDRPWWAFWEFRKEPQEPKTVREYYEGDGKIIDIHGEPVRSTNLRRLA